ncbi:alpha-galactosidase [Maribellus maritimus]|uniref:alpha-galactosidase n=1 Tax=Maribellus maritimus TaxID=2870838 RepID=UPI001EEC1982|nr:alpha-galactosidase [Maribellus maritimus]MCG6188423.1 alpha-galactosidase [Maribellus maritimus]
MNFRILIFFLFISVCLFSGNINASETDKIVIENNVFSKTIFSNAEKPDKIEVLFRSKPGNKILTSKQPEPYFEFVIDKQIITANDPLWVFKEQSSRKMQNKGTEYRLVFEGKKNPVKGLQIILFQQIFPNSTLMREKMVLQPPNKTFELNKKDGKLYFKFPVYSILNTNTKHVDATEIRMASWEKEPVTFGDEKKGNHMYYPDIIQHPAIQNLSPVKGPVSIVSNGDISWFTAYEHASQDDLNGLFDEQKKGSGNMINDAMQGTKGIFNFPISEDDFKFIGIGAETKKETFSVSVDILRGGYLDGEKIENKRPYSTVWTAAGFYTGKDLETGKAMLRNYLFNQICEKPASRIPEYYYNTWGLQRQDRNKPLRGILTYERIFEEIEYAAELGVDIFVLDDGWENAMGEWFPNKERFPEGLAPIKKQLDKYGIKMGLWYSPMGIDSTTQRYKEHPGWVIKDSEGNPIQAQWGHPAFDFVSGFFDVFINDCKKMIDVGCRFMKWDAINTFYSSLPNLEHGSDSYSKEELRARYEYLLPIYVVRAMEILTNYEPELVIEVDLTEARRVMVGLAPLSQGKLFWMNNGASWYNDYSTYRAKSMRTIANEFNGTIPLELFTYANYPQNEESAMNYNVHNSVLAGHGFWGNLQLMSTKDRQWVNTQLINSKRILPYILDTKPLVLGKVGDSPEIYTIVNPEKAAGQVIAFSENPSREEHTVELDTKQLLGVLNCSYTSGGNNVKIPLSFKEKESSLAAYILPNDNTNAGISVISSTVPVNDITFLKNKLSIKTTVPGEQQIQWAKNYGEPLVKSSGDFEYEIEESDQNYLVKVRSTQKNSEVILETK